jgi:hypothetical protein
MNLQQKLHFDVQPLMARSSMKFAQCYGIAVMELLTNLIVLQDYLATMI